MERCCTGKHSTPLLLKKNAWSWRRPPGRCVVCRQITLNSNFVRPNPLRQLVRLHRNREALDPPLVGLSLPTWDYRHEPPPGPASFFFLRYSLEPLKAFPRPTTPALPLLWKDAGAYLGGTHGHEGAGSLQEKTGRLVGSPGGQEISPGTYFNHL